MCCSRRSKSVVQCTDIIGHVMNTSQSVSLAQSTFRTPSKHYRQRHLATPMQNGLNLLTQLRYTCMRSSFLLLHFSYIFIYNLRKNPYNGWTRRERAISRSYSLCAFMAFQAYCGPEAKVRRNHIFFLFRASGFCFVCVSNSFAISLVLHQRSL